MNCLLDTIVLAELRKLHGDANVLHWVGSMPSTALFVSVISLYQLQRSVAVAEREQSDFARSLARWLEAIPARYGGQLLAIDGAVANRWGRLGGSAGRMTEQAAIAATAQVHRLVVATPNAEDFLRAGVPVLNPFQPNPQVVRPTL